MIPATSAIGLAMVVPVYLEMAQWALLLLLGLLVIIMFRQLGRLFNRESRPERAGLIGTKAPDFGYLRVGDNRELEFPAASGQPTLIAFVDPTCPSCEELVANLGEVAGAGELPGFRVLLLTADPPSYLHISEIFKSTRLELGAMTSRETRAAFDAATTPLLVAIDPAGFIRASDHVRGRAEIVSLSRAATLPPAGSMIELKPVPTAAE
jgi:hypothetical protein